MSDITGTIRSVIHQLQDLLHLLEGDGVGDEEPTIHVSVAEAPTETYQRISNKICVYCGQKLKKSESVSRGCHSRCAQRVRRSISNGTHTDRSAVAQGLWAPARSGGRPTDEKLRRKVAKEVASATEKIQAATSKSKKDSNRQNKAQ